MVNRRFPCLSLLLLLGMLDAPAARAQWAVVDVGAIAQLIQQYETLQQQLTTAQDHLVQAQQEYQSITGSRGMERLLSGTARNYLPADWTSFQNAAQSAGGTLGAGVSGAITANAVLTTTELAALAPVERQQIAALRQITATQQSMAREALANTSSRFAAIQRLIDAIPTAIDQKAVLDLQARISAEQGMLQNEHTKLQVLYQAMQAEQQANTQRLREQVIAGHGNFDTRFQPTP